MEEQTQKIPPAPVETSSPLLSSSSEPGGRQLLLGRWRQIRLSRVRQALEEREMPTWQRLEQRVRNFQLPRIRARGGFFAYLAVMGPGLIAANAGNDAGGIATYATAGASQGYGLLWMMALITVSLGVVQEMCARMGAITGKGLSDLIREQFGVRWAALAMLTLLIANTGTIISEFVGIAASAQLLGIPIFLAVPIVAIGLWWLIVKGSYNWVEKIFLVMSLAFFSYIPAAFLAHPRWDQVFSQTIHPTFKLESSYLLLFVATVGTTITPYMQLYVQSSVAEKGIKPEDFRYERADVYSGSIFSNLIAAFIIIATGAILFVKHISINTAADAAQALAPLAGRYASLLFSIGLFGASLLAAAVLPLATAYAFCETFGFEKGVSQRFQDAPVFMGLFTGLIVLGTVTALIPGLPLLQVLLGVQVLNGILLPVILLFILRLVNNKELMGNYTNKPVFNSIAWISTILAISLSVLLVTTTILPLLGVNSLFGIHLGS